MRLDFENTTALSLAQAIQEGTCSVPEVTQEALRRIEERDPTVHAFLTVDAEWALQQAEEVQRRLEEGNLHSPLAGIPIAIKDNICTRNLRTTCASHMLESFMPFYDADVVEKLRRAGLIIVGKTNMDEFAMGSTTETSYFGPTDNPAAPGHVPGGSSGGSCAAVAAGMVPLALGSDTGGSIRQPSAYCGVTGMKPTYGAVSRYGLIAYGSSLDQIGPIARTVEDTAALLSLLVGKDERDSTSVDAPQKAYLPAIEKGVVGRRFGLPRACLGEGLQEEIRAALLETAEKLRAAGASVEEFDLTLLPYSIPAYYVIACAEASSNLERFDGVKYGFRSERAEELQELYTHTRSEGFGPEVRRRILLGSFVLSSGYYDAYYLKALRVKAKIKEEWDHTFSRFDAVLMPAAPTTAPRLGASLSDPLQMYLSDIYTVSANLCGIPGIAIPVGEDVAGLPIGIQILADCFQEETLFSAAQICRKPQKEEAPLP